MFQTMELNLVQRCQTKVDADACKARYAIGCYPVLLQCTGEGSSISGASLSSLDLNKEAVWRQDRLDALIARQHI